MSEPKYYDWNKTFSFDAPITFVISHRGIGKTYGMRKQFVLDYLKKGRKFVHLVRYKARLGMVEADYFLKVGKNEFPDYEFKTMKHKAYLRLKDEEKPKPWQQFGYFASLSDFQAYKESTFTDVKRILLDEAIIDKDDKFHNYLPNETNLVYSVLSSSTREHAGDGTNPRLYLLGNATDINCPYLQFAGVFNSLEKGYSWHLGKKMLIHYDENQAHVESQKDTLAGLLASGKSAKANLENQFTTYDDSLFSEKSPDACFIFGLRWDDQEIGIWLDTADNYYYVNRKCPVRSETYSLNVDGAPNYLVLPKINPYTKVLFDAHRMGFVRYKDSEIYSRVRELFEMMGFRVLK